MRNNQTVCVFKKENGCMILTHGKCQKCSFMKTREELDNGRRKASERIKSLPMVEKEYIQEKYYDQKAIVQVEAKEKHSVFKIFKR